MIELESSALVFRFPEVHTEARFRIDFQRTLRIPDDGTDYALPPGLGRFPLEHVDDYAERVPESWLRRGGVMFPMYQSEAMWLNFASLSDGLPYPFALKIAAGKINAVTGDEWESGLQEEPQDYVVVPEQPWLDGYCVEEGLIRQFIAMPLGAGYTAEEQVTGRAEHGGVQIIAYPMRREAYETRRTRWEEARRVRGQQVALEDMFHDLDGQASLCMEAPSGPPSARPDLGLAPGGRMRQEIYDDPYRFEEWDTGNASRCFVHLANSMVWQAITGRQPPTTPPTAEAYTRAGLPWFDYYADGEALQGSGTLAKLKSVLEMGKEKGDMPLPQNESATPDRVVKLRSGLAPGQVREGSRDAW